MKDLALKKPNSKESLVIETCSFHVINNNMMLSTIWLLSIKLPKCFSDTIGILREHQIKVL